MATSAKRRAGYARRGSIVLGAALIVASFMVTTRAQAQNERMYIKHNGKIAAAFIWNGEFLTRSHEQPRQSDTGGLQIKNSGNVVVNIGPDDPTNPERLGTFNAPNSGSPFEAVREQWFQIFMRSGTLRIKSTGPGSTPIFEFDHVDRDFRTSQGRYGREFGFRKDHRDLTDFQKQLYNQAVLNMDNTLYPGAVGSWDSTRPISDRPYSYVGTSYWDKASQIHQMMFYMVHEGQGLGYTFLPWHRMFLNWMEDLMRASEPLVSLPYWNWQTNPVMDSPAIISAPENGNSGWLGQARERIGGDFEWMDNAGVLELSFEEFDFLVDNPAFCGAVGTDPRCDPSKPPQILDRDVHYDDWPSSYEHGGEIVGVVADEQILSQSTWEAMREVLERDAHNWAHHYLCSHGEIHGRRSPMDPMFWLLHANADRLWAEWQKRSWATRTAEGTAYGAEGNDPTKVLHDSGPSAGKVEPWATGRTCEIVTSPNPVGGKKIYPFDKAAYQKQVRYKDPAILIPRPYK